MSELRLERNSRGWGLGALCFMMKEKGNLQPGVGGSPGAAGGGRATGCGGELVF